MQMPDTHAAANTGDRDPRPRARHEPRSPFGTLGFTIAALAFVGACTFESETDEDIDESSLALDTVTVSFQNGALPSGAYAGNTDATINQANPATNYGAATTCEIDGDESGGLDESCLLQWAVTGIPAGSIVKSASMTFQVVNGSPQTFNVYEARRSWNESQATWNNATSTAAWGTPGAMASTDRGRLVGTITGGTGFRTVTLNAAGIALVQSWVNGATNRGVIVAHPTNGDAIHLASSEHATVANRPKLTINYLPPSSPTCPLVSGTALDLDGVDDHVTMGVAPGLGLQQFTLEAWVKRTGAGQSAGSGSGGVSGIPLIAKGRGESDGSTVDCNYFFAIRSEDSVLTADFEDLATGANHPVAGVTPIPNNVWVHAAVTYNGTSWAIYRNGVLEATAAAGQTPRHDSIQHFAIGTAMNSTGTPAGSFDGVMDEVRVWNHARTQAQIQSGMGVEIASATGLVGRWALDEGVGTTAADSAGTNEAGTLVGGTWVSPGTPFAPAAPPQPSLTSPADDATSVSTTATLSAKVTDPDSTSHDVTFYGRQASASPDFTVVLLPDTQYYSASHPATFLEQTQWIVDNRDALNIRYVVHLGDMVDSSTVAQWTNADAAMSTLEDVFPGYPDGIPYCPAVGNHDQSPKGSTSGTSLYNTYFGVSRFEGREYYGGHYGSDNDNNYGFFTGGGMDFIVISLEYDTTPDTAVLDWADSLLKAYPDHRAIVESHYIVGTGNPAAFGAQGQAIYDALKDNPNLFMLVCGHIAGEGRRVDTFGGNTIHTMLSDYQGRPNGGDGWLRYMVFSPANDTVSVYTYSTKFGTFETDADSQFTLSYDMAGTPAGPWVNLGTANDVSTGSTASIQWPGLLSSTTYEWYAAAQDCQAVSTTSPRTFTTAP
ncbi:DNRLRE domain-containing protein [Sorangium sp. So ce1099]|uniref:DNRLRE domain-containing protein n=1 Tax=Sorangium sp. So ce1099 TaxID=3133331 RepID=UPI003F64312E